MTIGRRMSAIRSRRWLRPMAVLAVRRDVYDAVGGHAAVAGAILETWN